MLRKRAVVAAKKAFRRFREAQLFVRALKAPYRPILVHLVPIRKCNLACTYCNEFDKTSQPVPTETMIERVEHLAGLGTSMIHFSGGEPMLHPELPLLIRRVRDLGMVAGLLTNGLLLSARRIRELNAAGLDHLQISIDNVRPDEVSKKSLDILDKKLVLLAELAEFDVNINSVVGNDLESPEDALVIARRAVQLGLTSTVGVIHDSQGQLKPLSERHREVYKNIKDLEKPIFKASSHNPFQDNLIHGRPNRWDCRAGSRYLYVCEEGLVHYCSQQRGTPGVPLTDYSVQHLEREFYVSKACAPLCTVSCVHRTSWVDQLRSNPRAALAQFYPPREAEWPPESMPLTVRVLTRLFVPDGNPKGSRVLKKATTRLLRIK